MIFNRIPEQSGPGQTPQPSANRPVEPATLQSIALGELDEGSAEPGQPIASSLNPLHQIKTRIQVCVGEISMTVGELLGAKEHQVVTLDRRVEQPVDLILEGKVIARGQLVAVGEHFAVRITELPISLKV